MPAFVHALSFSCGAPFNILFFVE